MIDESPLRPRTTTDENGDQVTTFDDEVLYPPHVDKAYASDVTIKSLPAPPVQDVNLNVPFIHQLWDTPDWFDGNWACGPTAAAMVIAYYGLLEPIPVRAQWPFPHTTQFGWYVANAFTHNQYRFSRIAQTPRGPARGLYGTAVARVRSLGWVAIVEGQTAKGVRIGMLPLLRTFLEPLGNSVEFTAPDEQVVKQSLDAGHPVLISGRPFGLTGHIMVVRGYYFDPKLNLYGWIVNDPYGYRSDGSSALDGGNVVYLWREIRPKYMYIISGPGQAPK
jgi:hypothetical protein